MSGSVPLSVTGDMLGRTISFTSKHPSDPTTYTGIVSSLVLASLAPTYGTDLVGYNAAVQRVDNSVGDISTLHYFQVILSNNQDNKPTLRLFASEWLASLQLIQPATAYTLTIYDTPGNGEAAIINLLTANGYQAVSAS